MRSSTARANGDDESADYSFTNEDASYTPGKKKKKKSKKSESNDDDLALSTAVAGLSISDDNKEFLRLAMKYISTNGESAASELLELVHTRSSVFVEDVKHIQLVQGLQQKLLPFMGVFFNERMADDMTKKKRSLMLKLALRSPKDADQFRLIPSAIGATKEGYSCFVLEHPEISAAESDTIAGLNKSVDIQLAEYANGNSKAEKAKADADNVTRRNKMEHLIAAAYEGGDVTKPVKVVSKVLKLPKFNDIQQRTALDHWQGDTYNVDSKGTEEVKFRLNFSIDDIKGNDGMDYKKHVAWFLVAEIPLFGGDELTMKSPEAKKVMNEQSLFNKLLAGLNDNGTGPTETESAEYDNSTSSTAETYVAEVVNTNVISTVDGEETPTEDNRQTGGDMLDIIVEGEEGVTFQIDDDDAFGGDINSEQEHMSSLIREASESMPADVLPRLADNTIPDMIGNNFIGRASAFIRGSPSIGGAIRSIVNDAISPRIPGRFTFSEDNTNDEDNTSEASAIPSAIRRSIRNQGKLQPKYTK